MLMFLLLFIDNMSSYQKLLPDGAIQLQENDYLLVVVVAITAITFNMSL